MVFFRDDCAGLPCGSAKMILVTFMLTTSSTEKKTSMDVTFEADAISAVKVGLSEGNGPEQREERALHQRQAGSLIANLLGCIG